CTSRSSRSRRSATPAISCSFWCGATSSRGRRRSDECPLVGHGRRLPPHGAPRGRRARMGDGGAERPLQSAHRAIRHPHRLPALAAGDQPDSIVEACYSLARALGGFALAAVVGVALGVLMGRSAPVAAALGPFFSGTYPVPKIALFPIFIYLFGIGSLSKVLLIFLECLYPIVITTQAGGRAVNRVLVWSAANMGASRARILRSIVVPATAPFIFAGFRIALPIAM